MLKKSLVLLAFCLSPALAGAANLLEVYQQALTSDPTYQQAIATSLSTKEGVPLSVAALLPTIAVTGTPSVTKSNFSGPAFTSIYPPSNTQRNYALTLTVTQTVFNFSQFMAVKGALATSKQADATLNAALQDLMVRVAKAYFAVLQDEENLRYSTAAKEAFAEQLDQVKQQYDVGLKTITDVYTAQASYDASNADYIAAQTALLNDKENLRVITGKFYPQLSMLADHFPLVTPQPDDVEQWVRTAQRQNWSIKASQYAVQSARQTIRQQFGGHLPTVNLQGTMDKQYAKNINSDSSAGYDTNGPGVQKDKTLAININVPLFAGGQVIAQTNQAKYNYEVAEQQFEQTVRGTLNNTRQSYQGVISGISKILADKQTIKSTISSLHGIEAGYRVGTNTLLDVLNQQQSVLQAQKQYASDRYAYVNNFLALKQAAGTLGFDDLRAINAWLSDNQQAPQAIHRITKVQKKVTKQVQIKKIKSKNKHA